MSNSYGAYIIENNGGYERSAHVHRTTSYIANLKNNWAYKNKTNIPKLKNSATIYNKTTTETNKKYEERFANK